MNYQDFACPECKNHPLLYEETKLNCSHCSNTYLIKDGVPLLFPKNSPALSFIQKDVSLTELRDIYDKAYSHEGIMGTDLDRTYDQATKEILIKFAEPLDEKRILDVGTGIGRLWDYMPMNVCGYAVDPSHVGIKKALQRRPTLTVSASVGENLPFPNNFFDSIIAADTIEHTLDPVKTLAEIKRTIKTNGDLCVSFPIPDSLRKWGRNLMFRRNIRTSFIYNTVKVVLKRILLFGKATFQPIDRDLGEKEWIRVLNSAGFEIQKIIYWPEKPESPLVYLIHCKVHNDE
jgi:ubiquinone/menaquinone biosynthesis C-methylase UbiE/uncharacterized protein YbaR (Trm112 family)